MTGYAASDAGQSIYGICKEHGLTLTDWADLHPADKRFLRLARAEHNDRVEEEREDAGT